MQNLLLFVCFPAVKSRHVIKVLNNKSVQNLLETICVIHIINLIMSSLGGGVLILIFGFSVVFVAHVYGKRNKKMTKKFPLTFSHLFILSSLYCFIL